MNTILLIALGIHVVKKSKIDTDKVVVAPDNDDLPVCWEDLVHDAEILATRSFIPDDIVTKMYKYTTQLLATQITKDKISLARSVAKSCHRHSGLMQVLVDLVRHVLDNTQEDEIWDFFLDVYDEKCWERCCSVLCQSFAACYNDDDALSVDQLDKVGWMMRGIEKILRHCGNGNNNKDDDCSMLRGAVVQMTNQMQEKNHWSFQIVLMLQYINILQKL